ncbi:MAG: heme-copper oxidase subunit III [Calditrichaeota bacterium]|nr:heme-copper oxidase subunit III [Calditrichota bacterium]
MTQKTAAELGIHMPPPSAYPILTTIGLTFIPTGILVYTYSANPSLGELMIWFGVFFIGFTLMGWAHQVIKDKNDAHTEAEVQQQQSDLTFVTKIMLVSEGAVFGALFAHYYYHKSFIESGISVLYDSTILRPTGILETSLPAIATMILMLSSYTCHIAHHALMHGNKAKTKTYLLVTIGLGLIFLGIQGHEWGYLNGLAEAFTVHTGMFGTSFYLMTGFHGAHVAIGIVLLFLVYWRLELNHMDEKRHFSILAASWYWHFVDIIWIGLFFTIYLI